MEQLFRQWPLDLDWAFALALAWVAGEIAYRALRMPRISAYAAVGFLLGSSQAGILPSGAASPLLLANVAMGLVLFEIGYRINLRWLGLNPWIGVMSVVECAFVFFAVFGMGRWMGLAHMPAALVGALAMSTSPAAVLSVANERGSSGQVTERAIHLTAFSCVLAVMVFKGIVGYSVLERSGDMVQALWHGSLTFLFSLATGAAAGILVPRLLGMLKTYRQDPTVFFAVAVFALVSATQWLGYSTTLAALAFGIAARNQRTVLIHPERGFGALGGVLTILLFVFTSALLDVRAVISGAAVATALVLVRFLAKAAGIVAFSRISGVTYRKGALTAVALMPLSAFVLLLMEPNRADGLLIIEDLAVVSAMVLFLELVGPIATRWAIGAAGEAQEGGRS